MNNKEDIPVKFIVCNIVAVVLVITICDIIEPAHGVFTLLAIFFFFVVLMAISRFIEKSPSVQAIADGFAEYLRYLWVAWIGWQCHGYYAKTDNPDSAQKFILIIIAVTFIFTILANFTKHLKKHKNES